MKILIFIKHVNELDIIFNKYDPTCFSSVMRFDIFDIENDFEFNAVLVKDKNVEQLLNGHIDQFMEY